MAAIPASAAEASVGKGTLIYRTEQTLENGLTFVDELYEIASTRATDKTGYKTRNVYYGDTLVGAITIQASFRYDGSAGIVAYFFLPGEHYSREVETDERGRKKAAELGDCRSEAARGAVRAYGKPKAK